LKTFIVVLLTVLLVPSLAASQDCIDYEDYLHWVGGVDTPTDAYGVAVAGNYAYVAAGEFGGLQVIDVTDPANPQLVGSVATPAVAWDVAVAGSYAYVADGCALPDRTGVAAKKLIDTFSNG